MEMTETAPLEQICVPVTESSQPAAARRAAAALAQAAGFDEQAGGHLALVVTELATNLVKHAKGGELLMRRLGAEGADGVEVLSLDKGPGMSNLALSLGDGYSTTGTPGTGLGAVRRIASEFDVYSQPEKGTAVVARLFAQRRENQPHVQSLGVVRQAKPGEAVCGDSWIARWFADGWLCAVADGLGHGKIASDAATAIMEAVRGTSTRLSPVQVVEAAHQAARPTRGAALGVAVFDERAAVVRFAGIGNIAAIVLHGDTRRHLVSYNGIVGHEYRKASEFTHPWHAQSVLLLHSDGIATHWQLDRYPGILARDPSIIAGILYRDFVRGRDDATVVVLKQRDRNGVS
jgi:anti-sigma regulatory factor (Ser/Thr protein kinase)